MKYTFKEVRERSQDLYKELKQNSAIESYIFGVSATSVKLLSDSNTQKEALKNHPLETLVIELFVDKNTPDNVLAQISKPYNGVPVYSTAGEPFVAHS